MHYDKRSMVVKPVTMFGVDCYAALNQSAAMLGAKELLAALREKGVRNAEIARVLDLPSSRVAEMFTGRRRLQLDEAKKLVDHFKMEEAVTPLNGLAARLLVLHAAARLGLPMDPEDQEVEELARDFRAFSRFAADPKVRQTVESFEGFLHGLRSSQERTDAA